MRSALRLFFGTVVLAVITFGFYLTGSPSENRLFREDELRVQDLRSINTAMTRYVRDEKKVPTEVASILRNCEEDAYRFCRSLRGINTEDYEINVIDKTSYELCTTFARAAPFSRSWGAQTPKARPDTKPVVSATHINFQRSDA